MIDISPRQLEVFVAVAIEGSVRAAAEQLYLTQPAASMALGGLERQLGTKLFAREHARLRLNERGRELLPLAQEALERLLEVQQRAGGGSQELTGELRIGASNTVGNYRVDELLGRFVRAHPQVVVRLRVDNTHAIVDGIREHSLDVGCVEGPVARADMEVLGWREDHLVVCAPHDHVLARKKRLTPADFSNARWILREQGSATRTQSEQALASLPAGRTVLELGQIEAIKQAVIAGLGIACLPEVAVRNAAQTGRLKVLATPFIKPSLQRRLSLVVGRDKYRGVLVRTFLDAARA